MAYKQNNNPFKKLHGDLQGFGERHAAWKAKREEMPQKKYGHFSEGAKAYRADKKAGESRFQYDIRMRKEARRAADKPVTRTPEQLEGIDPKSEIKGSFSTAETYTTPLVNPNDKRDQSKVNFGIVPGMSFGEAFAQAGKGGARAGTDTFFWINPETQEEKTFLYDFEKKNEKNISTDVTVVGHGRQHAIDPHAGETLPEDYIRSKDSGKKEKNL